jgi:16S rRNA (adenine1518-N6/adenine1519-N6)-dimethyltransferase
MNSIVETKTRQIMKKYNIYPNKKLGQNFLIEEKILDKIVETADISGEDLVIEIGPGLGVLTSKICQKAGKVVAVELDRRFINILSDVLSEYNNYEIIHADVLKLDLEALIKEHKSNFSRVLVVANLPYYITTPVVMKLLEDKLGLDSIVVMVQKEVAQRMTAKPGSKDYGALTLAVNYYSNANMAFDVPSKCFIPAPEVTSSVVRIALDDKKSLNIDHPNMFFRIIKAAFAQRRKTLENGLANSGFFRFNKQQINEMLQSLEIDPTRRAETLSLEEYAKIANMFSRETEKTI